MARGFNPPVVVTIYLGSGKNGEKLRGNLLKAAGSDSLSELVVRLLKKADPALFKGVAENGKR